VSDRILPFVIQRANAVTGWTPPAASSSAELLRLFSTQVGSTTCIEISGIVDIATEAKLRAHLGAQIERGARDLLLDMSLVGFCDAAVARVLASTDARLRSLRGRVRVVDCSHGVGRLLGLTDLEHLLEVPPP